MGFESGPSWPESTEHTNIQCIPEKRKPINQVNFSENYNDLSKFFYIVAKFSLSFFFWHQLQDVLAKYGRARTISNGDVKIDLRRIWGYGLNGVCHVSEQRDVLKRYSLAFLLSLLSCFFCLDSWTWSYQLNSIILHKSILTCMSLNCSLSVMHWDIIMCLVSNESRETALDNEAYTLIKTCVAMKIY